MSIAKARRPVIWAVSIAALSVASAVGAKTWSDWSTPINVESLPGSSNAINTPSIDGCASVSPDGLTLAYNSFQNGNFETVEPLRRLRQSSQAASADQHLGQ